MQLASSNIVITATTFPPATLTQAWLISRGLVAPEDFAPGCTYLDDLSQSLTKRFALIATPERLQLTLHREDDEGEQVIAMLGQLVKHLPEVPFQAVGLNFSWLYQPEDETIAQLTRRRFYSQGPAFKEFDKPDAHFGAYMSRDLDGGRLKLDVKPVILQKRGDEKPRPAIQLAFNYHHFVNQDDPIASVLKTLQLWKTSRQESRQLAATVMTGEGS